MASNRLDANLKIDNQDIEAEEIFDLLIEQELDQPDMAAVSFSNQSKRWSEEVKEGTAMELSAGHTSDAAGAASTIFKGEVVGIEPTFVATGASRVTIRAFNALHKLARGKKSVSYKNMTDKDLVSKICGNYSLTAEFDGPTSPKYDHIYQHNQTDLEFLRLRAARIGCEIRVDDATLKFKKRLTEDPGLEFTIGESGALTLERFSPRLSTANQVSLVKVRAWDPKKKEAILGEAKPQSSKLGAKNGSEITEDKHANILMLDVDNPVFSVEQANSLAKSLLEDRLMNFVVGDAVCKGNPKVKPGIIVSIKVGDKRFDGKYYVTSVRHRYLHDGPEAGFKTFFKFKRDARGDQ